MSVYQGSNLVAGGSSLPSLFDFKWADHQLNDISWLRADTFSWQSGSVYTNAYQHLVDDISNSPDVDVLNRLPEYDRGNNLCYGKNSIRRWVDSFNDVWLDMAGILIPASESVLYKNETILITNINANPQSETISGITITYYEAQDGHKICLPDQESNIQALYNATGVAWYYILDTARFKLPRSKHEHYGDRPVVGNGMTLGFTNGNKNYGSRYNSSQYAVVIQEGAYGQNVGVSISTGGYPADKIAVGVTTDGTKSGMISTPVQDTDQYKYLYFYVGQYTQSAIEQTAGVTTEVLNQKADISKFQFVTELPENPVEGVWYAIPEE